MILKNARHQLGYDLEEFYFEKLNQELIKKLKTETHAGKEQSQHEHQNKNVIHVDFHNSNQQKKSVA